MRLTEKDAQGNWCLKGVRWEQLRAGQVLSKDVAEKLYGALFKLMSYEDTGVYPDGVETLMEEYAKATALLTVPAHEWIPVEERLPEKGDEFYPMNLVTVENGDICLGVYRWDDRKWFTRPVEGNINYGTERKVLAWMLFPEPYKPEKEEKSATGADWKGHYMDRFGKVN